MEEQGRFGAMMQGGKGFKKGEGERTSHTERPATDRRGWGKEEGQTKKEKEPVGTKPDKFRPCERKMMV